MQCKYSLKLEIQHSFLCREWLKSNVGAPSTGRSVCDKETAKLKLRVEKTRAKTEGRCIENRGRKPFQINVFTVWISLTKCDYSIDLKSHTFSVGETSLKQKVTVWNIQNLCFFSMNANLSAIWVLTCSLIEARLNYNEP